MSTKNEVPLVSTGKDIMIHEETRDKLVFSSFISVINMLEYYHRLDSSFQSACWFFISLRYKLPIIKNYVVIWESVIVSLV